MKITYKRLIGPEYMTGALRATSGKDMYTVKEPSLKTFKEMVVSTGGVPHSPLRVVVYRIYVEDIKSWTATHYSRHNIGVQFYIKSQRTDRDVSLPNRDDEKQGALINMMFDVNANALLNIAQARLCLKAAPETREVMKTIKELLLEGDEYDQILGMAMNPPCKWYNKCFEPNPCEKYRRKNEK